MLEMNRGCPSSALSLQNPALSPLQHTRVVKDRLGPAVLSLLGGILRKDGKNIAASARASDARYIQGENTDVRTSVSPPAC